MEIVIILFSIGLVVLAVWLAASGRLSGGASSPMSITALHDLAPGDKQQAIEVVIEEKAGKRWEEQTSGEGDPEGDEGKRPRPPAPGSDGNTSAGRQDGLNGL